MENIPLTINVITYNHEKYIQKCIDSLLSQKTNFNFIIKIFDDCSTDSTSLICQNYASMFKKKIIYKPSISNRGARHNCYRSYKEIDTEYYLFIEGDDYCCDNFKLQKQIDALELHPECSFCAHDTLVANIADKLLSKTHNTLYGDYLCFSKNIFSISDIINHPYSIPTHISSRIVRLCSLDINHVKHIDTIMFDACQMLHLLLHGNMYYIHNTMTTYQQTGEGLFSSSKREYRICTYMNTMEKFNEDSNYILSNHVYKEIKTYIDYILNYNPYPETIKKSLTKRLLRYLLPPVVVHSFSGIKNNICS